MSWPETLARLTKWSAPDYFGTSGRPWPPVYDNPRQLREDIRELLTEHEHVCEMLDNVMNTLNVEYSDMFPEDEAD
jgi:hypothetical protein